MKEKFIEKMIGFYRGNQADINHFLKVFAYAETIGRLEHLEEETQNILEIAAIVHDIACPLCREKYGNTNGAYQEAESKALLRPFLAEFALPAKIEERVIYLVTHHHTYTDVEGLDHQILLEADYLVNAEEKGLSRETVAAFGEKVFRTESGMRLLASVFLGETE